MSLWSRKIKVSNAYAISVTVILVLLLGLVGSGNLSIVAPDTNTHSTPCGPGNAGPKGGLLFSGYYGGGQFPSQPGTGNGPQTGPIGEIFEKTNAYFSWTDQGQGEAINVEGQLYACGPTGIAPPTIQQVRYHFLISTDAGASWHDFRQPDVPQAYLTYTGPYTPTWTANGWQPLPTGIVRIHGVTYQNENGQDAPIVDGSWLKVQVEISTATDGTNYFGPMAVDILQLQSALPAVQWQAALYQVGETAVLNYNVPVTLMNGGTAYYLTITNLNSNTPVGNYNQMPISQASGQATFTVTPDMFVPGNVNRIRAVVQSQIFNAAMQDTAAIDNKSLAPVVNSVTWNQPAYREGDSVVITISASPNPITGSPIVKYYVLAHVGGIKYYDQFTTSPTVTFTAANAGPLTVEVSAYDQAGRPSAVTRYTESVGPAVGLCVQFPNLPQCGPTPPSGPAVLVAIVLLGVGLGLLLVGLYVVPDKLYLWRLPFIGSGLLLTGIGLLLAISALLKFLAGVKLF